MAVGECGLDYFRNLSPPAAQRAAFIAQLEIAARSRKPVFLHQRDAHDDFAAILAETFAAAWSAGSRTASPAAERELEEYLALDLYIGITGWVCDERRGLELRRPSCRAFPPIGCCWRPMRPISCRATSIRGRSRGATNRAYLAAHRARRRAAARRIAARSWPTTTRNAVQFFGLQIEPRFGLALEIGEHVRARPQLRNQPAPGIRDTAPNPAAMP